MFVRGKKSRERDEVVCGSVRDKLTVGLLKSNRGFKLEDVPGLGSGLERSPG